MGMDQWSGLTAPNTKANGSIIRLADKGDSFTLTETYTRELGSTIKQMGMEFTRTLKVLAIAAIGRKISNMGRVLKLGLRGLDTRAITRCPKRKALGCMCGQTGPHIAEIGQITK